MRNTVITQRSTARVPPKGFRCAANFIRNFIFARFAALGGLVVSVLTTGPRGLADAGSVPAEDGGILWVTKIRSAHFLRRGSKAVGPMS
jgi:hypothetical protein